jgi:hypothetical protein
VRLLADQAKIHATFDDPDLVSRAGLVPVMALACRAGLAALVEEHVQFSRPCGVNVQVKVPGIVAGMTGGADSIDDLDLLRHGASQRCSAGSGHRPRWGRSCARSPGEREKAPEKTLDGSCAEAEGQAARRTTQRAHQGRWEGRVQTPRPASLTVATSLGGAAQGVEEAWSHSVRSPPSRAFHQGRRGTVILTAPPRRSHSQRGAARRLGPMLRAAVVSTVTLRRFRS